MDQQCPYIFVYGGYPVILGFTYKHITSTAHGSQVCGCSTEDQESSLQGSITK